MSSDFGVSPVGKRAKRRKGEKGRPIADWGLRTLDFRLWTLDLCSYAIGRRMKLWDTKRPASEQRKAMISATSWQLACSRLPNDE